MTATNDIKRPSKAGRSYGYPVLAGVILYGRTMAGITANKEAVPAGHASAVKLIGFVEERIDNRTGPTGDQNANLLKGVWLIPLPGATVANIGAAVYASADDTFTLTAGALLQAGTIDAIDAEGRLAQNTLGATVDINSNSLRAINTGLSTAYNARFASVPLFYTSVAMVVPSSTALNEYPRLDDLPGMREWIGDRVINDLSAQTYIIRNREFEKTISIKRSQIEDDQIGIFAPVAAQMGQDAAEFPDQLVFPLFKKGDVTLCYDGQYFFDIDHPGYSETGAEISVSNFTDGAGPAWYLIDDSQVVKPMVFQSRKPFHLTALQNPTDPNVFFQGKFIWGVDGRCNAGFGLWQLAYKSKATLNAANYSAARASMMTLRRRNGSVLNIRPTKLLVPPSLEGVARQLINAELVNGGESNVWAKTVEIIVVPYLQ